MKRIIMMVLRNILFVPYGWFMLCRYARNVDNYTEGERYALLKKIAQAGKSRWKYHHPDIWCRKYP